jgi:putative phosphoribosyl transferase
VLAVPVAAPHILRSLRRLADRVVCLAAPEPFRAVGLHYAHFEQTSDDEVVRLLAAAHSPEKRH